MRNVLCWGGPMDGKTKPVFRHNTFAVPGERYQLLRITYRDKPTLKVYEVSIWLADSFDRTTLDGAPIVAVHKELNLPLTVTDVPADSPCWNPETHKAQGADHGRVESSSAGG